ncbi:unnamed protein product, partial [Adineta steineri]
MVIKSVAIIGAGVSGLAAGKILLEEDGFDITIFGLQIGLETASGDHETFEFDLIVVATGLFSTPEKPNFCGQNNFAGSIQHITDIKSEDQLKNKRILVIGGAKSAVDMATLAALHANYGFSRIFTHIFDPFPNVPHSAAFYFFHRVFSFVFTKITDSIAH